MRAAAGPEQRSPKLIKTPQVEPVGTGERFCTLPGEISLVRAGEKSAEAVVAEKPRNGGGAKGRRTKRTELEKELERKPGKA